DFGIACMDIGFSVLGIISAILSLYVFCGNAAFSSLWFLYFRVISILDLFSNISSAISSCNWIDQSTNVKSYWLFLFTDLTTSITINVLSGTVDMIIVFLSFERAVACLLPLKFHLLHKKSVAVVVFVASFAFSFLIMVPEIFGSAIVKD